MADKTPAPEPDSEPGPRTIAAKDIGRLLLDPLNFSFAAGERKALELGVPAKDMIEMLLNHLASVVAMLEPAGVREETVKALVRDFGSMVRQHVDARNRTPGGIILPQGRAA